MSELFQGTHFCSLEKLVQHIFARRLACIGKYLLWTLMCDQSHFTCIQVWNRCNQITAYPLGAKLILLHPKQNKLYWKYLSALTCKCGSIGIYLLQILVALTKVGMCSSKWLPRLPPKRPWKLLKSWKWFNWRVHFDWDQNELKPKICMPDQTCMVPSLLTKLN